MKDIIKLHDRKFKIMIPAEKIDEAVSAVAQRINEDYGDKETPLFVGVLNGSFMFMSDLIKKIEFNNEPVVREAWPRTREPVRRAASRA